ncbi:MAG: tol-pal system protein YbgF [Candidatus Zixiibacteriota bacterium]
MYGETKSITVIALVAVIIAALLGGCCTKRDVDAINDRLAMLESQSRDTQNRMAKVDSLMSATTESNRQLQNDVRQSTDALGRQLAQLLENYSDLISRLDRLPQQPLRLPPGSSPGAQQGSTAQPPTGPQPSADCMNTYDDAFTQMRRGEYEFAAQGFTKFLADCGTHADAQNVHYWIGECYYSQEKYTQAITEYESQIKDYPSSPKTGPAIYKLARCKQELGKAAEAKQLFQRLVKEFSGTLEAEQAAERLKDL